MAGDVQLVVLVVGPLRRAPIDRRHEIIVARGDLAAGLLGGLGLGLAPARHRLERRRDVGHLLDALADAGDVGAALRSARARDVNRARLVPVDAVGADDVVEQPALLLEALHMRLAALVHDRLRDALHEILPLRSFAPDLPGSLGESRSGIDSPCLAGRRALRYAKTTQQETRMPGKTIKIRSTEGGEFDCYLALPAGGDKVPAVVLACACTASMPTSAQLADEFAGHGYHRRRARSVLANGAGAARPRRQAHPGALAAAAGEDQGRRARHGGHAGASAHAAAVQRPRRDDGLLLRRALRHPRAEAARLCRRHLLPRLADAGLHRASSTASPSRSASSGATRITARRRRCWTPTARCRRA